MDRATITKHLKREAQQLGFDLVGACPAVAPSGLHNLQGWLAAGYAGEMRYLSDRAAAYEHPDHVLAGVRSLLVHVAAEAFICHASEASAPDECVRGSVIVFRIAEVRGPRSTVRFYRTGAYHPRRALTRKFFRSLATISMVR